MEVLIFICLLGTKDSVARIAQTGNDVAVIVELLIDRADVDIDVGMILLNLGNALGRADQAHEADVFAAAVLQELDARSSGQEAKEGNLSG